MIIGERTMISPDTDKFLLLVSSFILTLKEKEAKFIIREDHIEIKLPIRIKNIIEKMKPKDLPSEVIINYF